VTSQKTNFSDLLDRLPPIIWRSRWDKLAEQVGLPYRRSYLQNLDSENLGPKKTFMKNRVAYRREDVLDWLNSR
jgi:hypothetical protein